ncbi:hypothetical protein MLD38_006403 [Melastoma candidum]|uniref:Uncharacterized protein n=1 Tax=Melastoma candidum TaxID=119954 RepID=A0ACB9RMU0_9MYRT|nr:hypothetical protein MLD38_006403 [Melastoma candidum]
MEFQIDTLEDFLVTSLKYTNMVETAPNDSIIEFKWGEKRSLGGKRRDVQFYNSFFYDGIWYNLYDSVYLYKEGEAEPYVGKVIKIWENPDKSKKVKILWLFHPREISNHLGGTQVLRYELFLATGEGAGLANVNPLEAIAGKCNILCISKDRRNPQPSHEDVEMAEFVFYRAFDVGQLKLKETIDDNIAGVEAKYLFNRVKCGVAKLIPFDKEDEKESRSHFDGPIPLMTKSAHIVKEHVMVNEEPVDILFENKDTTMKVLLNGDENFGNEESCDPFKVGGNTRHVEHPTDDRRPLKRAKLGKPKLSNDADEAKTTNGFEPKKALIGISDACGDRNERRHHGESSARDKSLQCKISNMKSQRLSSEPSFNNDEKTRHDLVKIPPRLEIDKSKWFKELPWEERLQTARELGTLVLLQNLDPSYTSAEVEDIVRWGFDEGCSAKTIQQTSSSVPHSGKAFVIFKRREAAEKVVRKLDTGCLLLPNGRPLISTFGNPCFGKKQLTFAGHLSINDPRLRLNYETREAVATSHCSQPNTLEYDLAMEWCLLQQRSKLAWQKFVKRQEQELRQLRFGGNCGGCFGSRFLLSELRAYVCFMPMCI